MTPAGTGATIAGMDTLLSPALAPPKTPAHRIAPEPAEDALGAERLAATVAAQHGASTARVRMADGVVVVAARGELADWRETPWPAIDGALRMTIDLRAGGWRRDAADAAAQATHANGLALAAMDAPARPWARGRFDVLTLVLRQATLDAHADAAGVPRWADPGLAPTAMDPLMGGMAAALASALDDAPELSRPYLAPLVRAVLGRVLSAHVRELASRPRQPGALAPWQERKAKALLTQHVSTDISITEVARACKLSRSHFCKAFKQATGQSPYAWLTHYRISTAQSLLRSTQQPLADIALACGFGDQSHLTRMFSRVVGTPPGSWRRARAG
jgi:AraC-like DNA-binding protein